MRARCLAERTFGIGSTSAQSLAMHSTGVMIRQRETRRDDFFTR